MKQIIKLWSNDDIVHLLAIDENGNLQRGEYDTSEETVKWTPIDEID